MDFKYSRQNLTGKERLLERILEMVPGGLSWSVIIGMSVLSFIRPLLATAMIIAFLLFWLLRLIYMNILLIVSYARYNIEKNTDWVKRIEGIDHLDSCYESICRTNAGRTWQDKISNAIHIKQLKQLRQAGDTPPKFDSIHHVVIIPVIRESCDVVEPGIIAIHQGSFPSDRIILLIALEQRASQDVKKQMYKLQEKHKDFFRDFLVIEHPDAIPGEANVKGANITFAARRAAEYLRENGIPYENVIASCFDADTVAVQDYFNCLTYHFIIEPNRLKASFQPIPVYFNNIWDVPAFARIIDIGISFFQLIETTDTRNLVTFSSHSMSFKTLADMDYWPVDIISDDSAVYWKALLHYGDDYRVIPIPVVVSMDVVTGRNTLETIANIYKQKRRWAWGIENFPIVIRGFLRCKTVSLYKKIMLTIKLLDNSTSWATTSFLLTVISWMPLVFATRQFASTTVYYIAPRIRSIIFLLASFGIAVCMLISFILLPPEKGRFSLLKKGLHCAEWLLIPFVVLVLSELPALDAQTRLMFGKYLEFWVTDKYRLK
jgi:hypothetical protein